MLNNDTGLLSGTRKIRKDPKAFVVLREGGVASPDLARELQESVKRRITPYKYPRHIQFIDKLPKTVAGKLLRYKLRELN